MSSSGDMAPAKKKKLGEYERKRDFKKTPEPSGSKKDGGGDRQRFVIQEHHATSLHWDLRLERDGVLVSWAVPKGIPPDPKKNHLAVHVEDHPLDYIDFEGEIPEGNYGAGKVTIWDEGTYECEKFRDDEVMVTFDGGRVRLVNRNARDTTAQYPELRQLGKEVGPQQMILDGEVVAFDDNGRP